ncbi:MAG: hemolysin family protein [Spirochaetaceae bacterium]|jgi:putative hemolysin|nr:hemolysin family protein [Spirochaetaceae bacterium]
MSDPLLWQLLLQLVLIGINAVFACAEIALISVNDTKLEQLSAAGDKRAKKLLFLTKQPARFLATIQVGITLAGFLGSAFAADNFAEKLTTRFVSMGIKLPPATLNTISVVTITIILSYLTLILGELVPKRLAMKKAEALAFAMSALIYFISKLFAPVVWFLTKSTNILLRLLRIDPDAEEAGVTEEEIRMMIDVGSAKGAINPREKEIIHNVFEFDDKAAVEVMTHRIDVVLLRLKDSDEEWEKTLLENRHRFYPVCGETPDDVQGILSAQDYFRLPDRRREAVLDLAVHPAVFIPESVKTDIIFKNMKRRRNHFAVVLDEYGGMSGILTMNDLLEQLVGDLGDDSTLPPERPLIEKTDPQTWRISGAASLDQVESALGVPLPVDKYDTFGGFVFSLLGHVPDDGATPELEGFGLFIKLTLIKDHRLEEALVRMSESAAAKQ